VIGADDPFWTTPEQPLPIETGDIVEPIVPAGWLVSGTQQDGIVRVINHGVDHSAAHDDHEDPLYGRLAYSTVTAPAPREIGTPADNQVVLVGPNGETTQRVGFRTLLTARRIAASAWGPITCTSVVHGAVEVRIIRLQVERPDDLDGVRLLVSGYAVPQQPMTGARRRLRSDVQILLGEGKQSSADHDQDNPFGSRLLINSAEFVDLSTDQPYAVGISLTDDAEPVWPSVIAEVEAVRVSWPDGTVDLIN
jgi:hypothetical protein